MKKRQRLKRGASSKKRDRLTKVQQFEQTIGQPPVVTKSSETNPIVSVSTAYHKPFSEKGFDNMVAILKEKAGTVDREFGDVSIHVPGDSPLVDHFKKHGDKLSENSYMIKGAGVARKSDAGGYDVRFGDAKNNPEVYGLAVKLLAYMNVPASLHAKSEVPRSGMIKQSVGGKEISVDFDKHELNMENVREMSSKLQKAGEEVSGAVGGNWFPCGSAHIEVDKKSPLVAFFKEHGTSRGGNDYTIDGFGRISTYGKEVWLSLECYPQRTATEQQALGYQEPIYSLAMKMLEKMGVKGHVNTWVD
jgi:hypothetical protein